MLITVDTIKKDYIKWDWQAGKDVPFTEEMTVFTLTSPGMTYAFAALESGYLAHIYYGKRADDEDLTYLLRLGEGPYTPGINERETASFMDNTPFEYPSTR